MDTVEDKLDLTFYANQPPLVGAPAATASDLYLTVGTADFLNSALYLVGSVASAMAVAATLI